MSVKNVIFDFGGVLIRWNPYVIYDKWFGDKEKSRWFIENICDSEWNSSLDKGKPFEQGVLEKIQLYPEYETEIRMYKDRWKDSILGPIQESVNILEEIHHSGKYRLLGITNWSHETFPYALENFHFLHYFEDIVVSGEVKMIKPNKDIFLHSIERFGIQTRDSIFIDDSLPNIETAKSLGFKVIHFKSAVQLKAELIKFGIFLK